MRRVVLVVVSTAIAVLLSEGIVRIAGLAPELHRIRPGSFESAYRYSENPILGYEFKPGYRSSDPDLHESFPFINSHGLRDIERTVKKKPGTRRILVLGDSVVAGHGIEDVRDTVPLQLERLLAESGTEVLNFGVGGYCTRAEVELLRVKGLAFQPDVVILVYVANDIFDLNEQVDHYPFRVARPAWSEWLFVNSHLFRYAAFRFDWFRFRTETDPEVLASRHLEALGEGNVDAGLALLRELSARHSFDCFVVIWPFFLEETVDDAELDRVPRKGLLAIERIAPRHGIPTYRLSEYFIQDHVRRSREDGRWSSPIELYSIGDSMHPSPVGARVAAEAIAAILATRGR
jgi:lysophospholipase L1-like esterase